MDNVVFYMKNLIPHGNGALTVHRFAKNTQEGADQLRDHLIAAGDWHDADQADYDNFQSAVPAVAGVLNGEVWRKVEDDEPKAETPQDDAGEAEASEGDETPSEA